VSDPEDRVLRSVDSSSPSLVSVSVAGKPARGTSTLELKIGARQAGLDLLFRPIRVPSSRRNPAFGPEDGRVASVESKQPSADSGTRPGKPGRHPLPPN
jgi:hypothetical protein